MRNVWLRFAELLGAWVLILTIAAGCSGGDPISTTQSDISISTTISAPDSIGPAPSSPSATTQVSAPQVSADPDQEGYAAPIWDDFDYGEAAFGSDLADIAATGAEWVTLVPTWYQSSPESSVIYPERPGRTATDEALVAAIVEAQALGLEVMLKPHVDLVDGGYRGGIEPASTQQWFESYGEVIVGYARLAEQHDIPQFVVGTELAGTSSDTAPWRDLIAGVRQVFSGSLTYAANHDEFPNVQFWDDLDFIGVDAYFPLAEQPTTDLGRLTVAWDPIIDELGKVARAFERSIVFTEVGYPSQEGASVQPYNPSLSTVVSNDEQEAALRAMLSSVDGQTWFGGFHWWMWFTGESPGERALGYMPQGKPAGAILMDRWE